MIVIYTTHAFLSVIQIWCRAQENCVCYSDLQLFPIWFGDSCCLNICRMQAAYMVTAVLRLGVVGAFALEILRLVWHFINAAQTGSIFTGKKCSWNLLVTQCGQAATENSPFWNTHLTVPVFSDTQLLVPAPAPAYPQLPPFLALLSLRFFKLILF